MKINRSQNNLSFLVYGTSIIKPITTLIICVVVIFILTGVLTSLKPAYRITSFSINNWTTELTGETFLYLIGLENRYYKQVLPVGTDSPRIMPLLFETVTSINLDDPRSFLGREIPYYSLYDGKILVAGEGTDYTNMPAESFPPLEVVMESRTARIENRPGDQSDIPLTDYARLSTNGIDRVYIYNTHTYESYLPQLEPGTTASEAYHADVNVTLVSKKLEEELEERGIGAVSDQTDFIKQLEDNGWNYFKAYDVSRPVVKQAIKQNKNLQFFFDIHRDWQSRENTTVSIKGINYGRVFFVVGGENARFQKNLQLAKDLHFLLEEQYPGISRGVTTKQGPLTDGNFNQDLSHNSMVIEFGGVENSLDEVFNTAEAVAEVFSNYYWNAEKVNAKEPE